MFEKNIFLKFQKRLLIVRYGVKEMLELLSTFCDFFVYSHGLKVYIMAILEQIDPDEKYFKNREYTVIAPDNRQ